MCNQLALVPRYRLDDEQTWLMGIDPLRRYWLWVNDNQANPVILPGLSVNNFDVFRDAILTFRAMTVGDTAKLPTAMGADLVIKCVAKNCYAIDGNVNGNPATHIFDQESLESLLMTAHPDWQCAPHHRELGQKMLAKAWNQPVAVGVA
ncbi:MAG: hypothetical protein AAGF98_05995 [Cyanobacteria bacterium P01_H01_bin.153]